MLGIARNKGLDAREEWMKSNLEVVLVHTDIVYCQNAGNQPKDSVNSSILRDLWHLHEVEYQSIVHGINQRRWP